MRQLELTDMPPVARICLLAVLAAPLMIMIVVFAMQYSATGTDQTAGLSWQAAIAVVGFCVAVDLFVVWAVLGNRVREDQDGLNIKAAGFLRRRVNFSQIDWAGAKLVDSRQHPQYALRWRTFGLGLPGFCSGYFRLRNGNKCFAVVSGREALYLPLQDGQAVMLSLRDAQGWLRRHQP